MKSKSNQHGSILGKLLALIILSVGVGIVFAPNEMEQLFAEIAGSASSQSINAPEYASVAASREESLRLGSRSNQDSWAGGRPSNNDWPSTDKDQEKITELNRNMNHAYQEFVRAANRTGENPSQCGNCYGSHDIWNEMCYWYCRYAVARNELERIRQESNFRRRSGFN